MQCELARVSRQEEIGEDMPVQIRLDPACTLLLLVTTDSSAALYAERTWKGRQRTNGKGQTAPFKIIDARKR
jgi:hypothetical protein